MNFWIQEREALPLPKIEGDDRAQARALAIIHSHPVVSLPFHGSLDCRSPFPVPLENSHSKNLLSVFSGW